jgi:hypothetical protein
MQYGFMTGGVEFEDGSSGSSVEVSVTILDDSAGRKGSILAMEFVKSSKFAAAGIDLENAPTASAAIAGQISAQQGSTV